MKLDFSTFRFPASARAKILTMLVALAIGGAALSLGGCSCADPNGDQIACPEQY